MSKSITVPGGSILQIAPGKWLANQLGEHTASTHTTREVAEAFLAQRTRRPKMPTVKVKTKATGKAKASGKAATKAPAKREAHRADVDKQRKQVAAELKKGKKIGEIAEALHVTSGRAKYLQMLNDVEAGNVASISTSGNDDAVAKRIITARDKQDEYSSWGWISARTGMPEAKVKKLAEDAGHAVKGSHVAKERAAKRAPAKAKAATKAGKGKAAKGKGNPSQKT